MLEYLKVLLFGIIEGITEWLPVSSTGHLIILEQFLPLNTSSEFFSVFEVVIQLGAILAVVIYFFNKLNPFFGKSLTNTETLVDEATGETKTVAVKKTKEEKKKIWILWAKVLVACIPAAVVGLVLDDWLDAHLYNALTVSITLIVYGVLFIALEIWNKKRTFKVESTDDLKWSTALFIGCFQLLALIPGTSRSGVTILGAMLLLCNRQVASEFSFFLSIPVMFGASLLKLVKYFVDGNTMTGNEAGLLLFGCAVAFGVSLLCVKMLMSFIRKHDFKPFGIYRIALGVILLILFLCGVMTL